MEAGLGFGQAWLEDLARRVAARIAAGDAVLLEGPLGAGKTTFARALIRAACGNPALDVPSPSYTLVQSYETPRFSLHHFDLWRLQSAEALADLGWEDARDGVILVEWPDRLGPLMPAGALTITLTVLSDDLRGVQLTGWPGRLPALVQEAGLAGNLPP